MNYVQFREVESPLSAFNNIQIQITNDLSNAIYGSEVLSKIPNQLNISSNIIFEDGTITLLGILKLILHKNEMLVKVLKPLNQQELTILGKVNEAHGIISASFYQYLQMYRRIAFGYDDVPTQLINTIVNGIETKTIKSDKKFLIPFKNKVGTKLTEEQEGVEDKTMYIENFLCNIYNRYEYVIQFEIESKTNFIYKISKVLSSELNENKSLENIRFLEQDVLKTDTIHIRDAEKFVVSLFCYGNII